MHLALKSAMSRIPYTNKVGETLSSIADPAAAYSLRALGGGDPMVARVRRSSDDAEKDFTASDMDSGSVADWVNGKQDTTLPCDVASAAAAYSLRSVNSNYTGNIVRVRRGSNNAEKDFSDVSLIADWVNEDVVHTMDDGVYAKLGGTGSISGETNTGFTINSGATNLSVWSSDLTPEFIIGTTLGDTYKVELTASGLDSTASIRIANRANGTTPLSGVYNIANGTNTVLINTDLNTTSIYATLQFTGLNSVSGGAIQNITVTQVKSNGYVTTWYDQSGNGNNATQSTASSQPKIVDAGVLVSDGIDFDGVDDFFNFTNGLNFYNNPCSLFATCGVSNGPLLGNDNNRRVVFNSNELYFYLTGLAQDFDHNQAPLSGLNQFSVIHNGTSTSPNSSAYLNSVENNPTSLNDSSALPNDSTIFIGKNTGVPTLSYDSSISEIIIYDSDQSANRFKIESNINNHYDLYTNANDGFVTTWYDQSGNSNDATQSVAASQPKIVDGGVLVSDGIEFDGSSDFLGALSLAGATAIDQTPTISFVWDAKDNGETAQRLVNYGNWPNPGGYNIQASNSRQLSVNFKQSGTNTDYAAFVSPSNVFNFGETVQITAIIDKSGPTLSVNGSLVTLTEFTAPTGTYGEGSTGLFVGNSQAPASNRYTKGSIPEIIIYDSDQSANRAAIETNINNYYDIY